jgi:DNA-directed RNA polymerase specialized sigma24 family protein
MCGTCEVLIRENYKTIRKASIKYTSKFVETNDLINTVVLKFLKWKKNKQEANQPISINLAFFYTITKNAAIDAKSLDTVNFEDEVEAYETNAFNNTEIHQNLIAKTQFSSAENHALIFKYLQDLDEKEKDAFLSVVTEEPVEDYQSRNNIENYHQALKRRRRAFQKAQSRLINDDDNVVSINSREGL